MAATSDDALRAWIMSPAVEFVGCCVCELRNCSLTVAAKAVPLTSFCTLALRWPSTVRFGWSLTPLQPLVLFVLRGFFLSRSGSGRSYLFPLGWAAARPWVQDGNIMNARCCVLLMLLAFGQCTFVLEQPVSSLFGRASTWLRTVRLLRQAGVKMWRQHVHLGAFGGLSQKTVKLFSNNRNFLSSLYRPLTGLDKARFVQHKLVRKGISKAGRPGITGVKAALRASQPGLQCLHVCFAAFLLNCFSDLFSHVCLFLYLCLGSVLRYLLLNLVCQIWSKYASDVFLGFIPQIWL